MGRCGFVSDSRSRIREELDGPAAGEQLEIAIATAVDGAADWDKALASVLVGSSSSSSSSSFGVFLRALASVLAGSSSSSGF